MPKFTEEQLKKVLKDFSDFCLDSYNDGNGEEAESATAYVLGAVEVFNDLYEEEEPDKKWSEKMKCWLYRVEIKGKTRWVTIPEEDHEEELK